MSEGHDSIALNRIKQLIDPGSFVELSESVSARLTDLNATGDFEESDGVVTGYGLIDGRLVFIYSQNPDVLSGSLGEMHCKKIAEVYRMAVKSGAPVIGLLDSTGFRLREGADVISAYGELVAAVNETSGLVPMFTVICGQCAGGLSLIPSFSDFNFVVKDNGRIFVNSPDVIDGNHKGKVDNGSAEFGKKELAFIDDVLSIEEVSVSIRELMDVLPQNNTEGTVTGNCEDDLNRLVNAPKKGASVLEFVKELADNCRFIETKKGFANDMLTGFAVINGITVGVFANNAEDKRLSCKAMEKAASFIKFCDNYDIPLLSISDVVSFTTSMEEEVRLAKNMAVLSDALLGADVPKVNVVIDKAIGTAGLLMNSIAMDADFVFAFDNSEFGLIDKNAVKNILFENDADKEAKANEYYETHNTAKAFAKRGLVSKVIDPQETRKYLLSAFDLLYTKDALVQERKHSLR